MNPAFKLVCIPWKKNRPTPTNWK